jgi:hypothetical protein
MHFHPAPKPIAPPKAPTLTVKKRNAARSATEFKRTYFSRARVKFVNLQPCAACDAWGYSQNAHVLGNDGASRKGEYRTIAPLCGVRPNLARPDGAAYPGCHHLYDEESETFRSMFPTFDAKRAARETQSAWLKFYEAAS